VIRVADIKEEKRIMAQPATKPTIDQDLKKWIEQVYPVFSELPEGKYLWAVGIIPKGFGPFWSLMSVNANAGPAEMTIDLDGVTVKGKPGAKGDGWRHVCKIGDARLMELSIGSVLADVSSSSRLQITLRTLMRNFGMKQGKH
jgi:hypothetical protein